ncbi:MAG: hypothetical protein ACRC7C_19620 [Beijerinckiaceae bacterium]
MQAPAYRRIKNFQENNGASTDHAALNSEFDKAALSIEGLRENAALLQNDDGTLKNEIVGMSNLTPAAVASLQVPGPQGPQGPAGPVGPQGLQGIKGDTGASFDADVRDLFANRGLYDLQPKGFSMLAMDTGLLYFKLSATSGDWSAGEQFGKGETGAVGAQGPQGIQGIQGLQGIQGIPGVGTPGADGADGLVASVDLTTKTASLIGRTSVSARLVVTGGELSIVLTTT